MSELPGTAAVGIDAVEWEAQDEGNLILRVSGRWRRRPRGTSGKPTLILESAGRRHRFTALPEPPGLSGAAPGAWRLSFTLPGTLAPDLGRTWLQFGTVIVPLPIAMPSAEELRASHEREREAERAAEREQERRREQELRRDQEARREREWDARPDPPYLQAVPDLDAARPLPAPDEVDIDDIGERVAALERDLRHARAGRDELANSLQERDRSRRIAEQRAHAESALRQDLARQLSANLREMDRVREAMGELAAAEERIRRLEAELELARRRSDEAEQVAAAARSARERAERERDEARIQERPVEPAAPLAVDAEVPVADEDEAPVVEPVPPPIDPAEPERLTFERHLALAWSAAEPRVPDEPAARALTAPAVPEPSPNAPVEPPAAQTLPVIPPRPSPAPAVAPGSEPTQALPLPLPTVPPRAPTAPASVPIVPDLLRRELDTRARAEAALRAKLIDAESTLAARIVIERRTKLALDELRGQLAGLRDAVFAERAAKEETEARLADARARVEAVREELSVAQGRADGAAEQIAAARAEVAAAQARIEGALAHAAQADSRAAQAEARVDQAEARIEHAASRVEQAESRAEEAAAQLNTLAAQLAAAETRVGAAETRARAAEARVGEAESERAAADAFAQTTAAARTAADNRAEAAERRARAAAAEAVRLREELNARETERAALAEQVTALQSRIAELEHDLSGQRVLSRDAYDAIGDLRQTLELVQARAEEARAEDARAEEAQAGAAAPEETEAVEAPGPAGGEHVGTDPPIAGGAGAPGEAGLVDAGRLSDALSRLRETVPPPDDEAEAEPERQPASAPPAVEVADAGAAASAADVSLDRLLHRRSLEVPFRRMVRSDPDAAGRLLIDLLPLQAAVHPRAVSYDLVLGQGRGSVCVTSPHGTPPIEVRAHPRPREEVDLQVIGDPARIARLLTAGRLRRILGIGTARLKGRREALAALQALIATPLDLTELDRGGVRLQADSAFGLVAAMIEPRWTVGERFVLAHEQDGLITSFLTIADGHPPRASRVAPGERVATRIVGPSEGLLCLLAGRPAPGLTVRGDEGPLLAVRRWLREAGHA